MKKIFVAVFAIILMGFGTNVFAQGKYGADSAECIKFLSYYQEYYKQKNYDEALPSWRKAFKICPPTASQNLYINGATLLKRQISKNANKPDVYKSLVDTLISLYDIRIANYPKSAVTALNNKGLDMVNYIKNDPQTIYNELTTIIGTTAAETKPSLFVQQLNSAITLYQDGKLGAEAVIDTYEKALANLDSAAPKTETDKEDVAEKRTALESLFITSKVASCDNLVELFTPRYNANPNDLDLVSNIVRMMNMTDGCSNNDLYLNAVTSMYKLSPNYKSAYGLFKLNSARGNYDEALKYIEEAINSDESDDEIDGQYYYELAVYCSKAGKNAKAYESAEKARTLNKDYEGKAYFLEGTIWGSAGCGGDEISRRAPYWVAVDCLQKAKAADPALTDDANRLISSYSAYYPQTAEAFMYDLTNGQSYTVSCNGMRATTTVRTQK